MNLDELLNAYGEVANKHGLLKMKRAHLSVVTEATLPAGPNAGENPGGDAWTWLQRLAPQSGWLQFQSRVVAFSEGQLPEPAEDWGVLLAAEAVLPDRRSLLLRPDGQGGLRAVVAAADADAQGEAPLAEYADVVSHRATGRAGANKTLRYTRYWRADPERGLIPVLAAFQGFFGPQED